MPEVTVHKDRHLLARKDDIRSAWQRPDMLPEAKPLGMESGTQLALN